MKETNTLRFYGFTLLLSLLLILPGRLSAYFYSVTATDISYSDGIVWLLGNAVDLFVCLRLAVGFAAIVFARYRFGKKALLLTALLALFASFADYLTRFLIDYLSGAVADMVTLSLIWVGIQFLSETVFLALGALTASHFASRHALAESDRGRQKFSPNRAVIVSALLLCCAYFLMEGINVVDFVTTYSDITGPEIASMVGEFLRIAVVYGLFPAILCPLLLSLLNRIFRPISSH